MYIYIYIHLRPTRSMIHVHCLIARFQEIVLLIVQYTCTKSCAEDEMLQDLILRTRLCGIGFITQTGWLIHFTRPKWSG